MHSSTRGFGLLEGYLSGLRAKKADSLIPPSLREGRILDIGCGTNPAFLSSTTFAEKHGMDNSAAEGAKVEGMTLLKHDFQSGSGLPYPDGHFDVITMLAVLEHIEPALVRDLSSEIYRTLKPGGMYILTTPAPWTDLMLRALAKLRLVSLVEIEDHKDVYSHSKIASMLQAGGFAKERIRLGYFEMRLNIWAAATKDDVL